MTTIDNFNEGDRVRGVNGYSIVKKDTNAPYKMFYAFVSQNCPKDWDYDNIPWVDDDDEDKFNE